MCNIKQYCINLLLTDTKFILIMSQHGALFFIYFFTKSPQVSGSFLVHHQEAKCIMCQWYFFYL
jgi:hypothetical protein